MYKPFADTVIDRSDIDQSLLDIDQRSRTSLFTWNGQFSPQFIEALLTTYANEDSVVYDPFAGSGTVLTESARKNLSAYGVELNPAAYFMAKSNELCMLSDEERRSIIDEVSTSLEDVYKHEDASQALAEWYASIQDEGQKDITALLIVLCDLYKNEATPLLVAAKWASLSELILTLPRTSGFIHAYNGDSREAPLEDRSANLVITSPFQEAAATAHDVKTAIPSSKYYLLCDFLDMKPISTSNTDIEAIFILRKAKRISSNVRKSYATRRGRIASRDAYKDYLWSHPYSVELFGDFIGRILQRLAFDDLPEEDVLNRSLF